jgi:glycosyltransferase involved in cell wall biosynthesis
MSSEPLVSVVMPVYNGARYLRQSLESALNQTYRPLEIVVVDDGSTDETPKILAEFGPRIRAIRQKNSGSAAARNAALQAAHGEIIGFLDADDLWLPEKLEVQVAYLRAHPDVELVATRWLTLTDGEPAASVARHSTNTKPEIDEQTSGWLYNELLIDCVVHTTTVLMRRSLVDEIGLFDTELRRGQDYDYWLRASQATEIHTLREPLSYYRLHAANSTWQPQRLNYGAMVIDRALRRWGRKGPDGRVAPFGDVHRRLSDLWFSFGRQHLSHGSKTIAFKAAVKSLLAWPLHAKPWLLLAACVATPLRRKPIGQST